MKEKIEARFQELHGDVSYPTSHVIDVAIEVLKEEIEKVELPKYKPSWTTDGEKFIDILAPTTQENTRQAILKILEG